MAEVAIQVGISIVSKIAEILVEPTISQFRYLFGFKSIVDKFKAGEVDLALAMTRVENQVNLARNNAEVIEEDVKKWMTDTATATEEVQRLKGEIQQDRRCFNKCCPNWLWRYRLGKKVAKKMMVLKGLKDKGKFTTVSHPAPLLDVELLPSKDFTPSESSREALNQIMKALKDDNISMIGLYGMGGVGKTTLAKEIANKVKELKLFDDIVFAVVSQNQNLSKIQDQIADKLGVKFDKQSEQGRADHLARRLQDERKKLVILDDMWKYLNLKDIGVLFRDDQKNCKILLTTRFRNVCISMDCQREIPLNVLNEGEAWSLFKKKADLGDVSLALHNLAMEVTKECKGLPIAIVTVGKALKKKETVREWQVALDKLKASRLIEIRDIDKDSNAYACLKFSFDELQREETRSCLLLCSLFPEDFEIFVEDLVRYAVGLGFYKDATTVENTRNEVLDAIAVLKNSCMLLETESEGYVKMHDVVRDFTLWVGSEVEKILFGVKTYNKFSEWKMKSDDYKVVSIMDDGKEDLTNGLVCPKLELLLLLQRAWHPDLSAVEYEFFRGMEQLKVLSLVQVYLLTQSLECLNNLQVLELVDCTIEDNFGPTLMMLKRLKILRCWGLEIEELPNEVGELENLKVLDLQGCKKLQRISPGIIQKLCRLEELYLINSFSKWESSDVMSEETGNDVMSEGNASLNELNWLPHLAILWLRLEDTTQIPRDFMFHKLSGYSIHVNCFCNIDSKSDIGHPKPNQLCVEASKVNACKKLLQNVSELKLQSGNRSSFGDLMQDIYASGLNDLISLHIRNLEMECLVYGKLWPQQQVQPMIRFSNLKKLHVGITTIKEICNGQPPEGFLKRLEDFYINGCDEIITALAENNLRQALQSVEVIDIWNCAQLQEVFQLQAANNDDNGDGERAGGVKEMTKEDDYLLSRLTKLQLRWLPNLRCIWKGTTHHVSLKSLTSLILRHCNDMKTVFSPSLAASLLHLQELEIGDCGQLKHVISVTEMEEETSLSKGKAIVGNDIKLPNLISIYIEECPSLVYVFPISIAPQGLPRLEKITLWDNDELKSVFENEINNDTSITTTIDLQYYLGSPNSISLPTLKSLCFAGCPKFLIQSVAKIWILQEPLTCSKQLANNSPPRVMQLEDLELKGCKQLENVIVVDEKDLLSFETHFQVQPHLLSCFCNLSKIEISNCNRLKSLFPITVIISGLPSLSKLEIEECSELVEVFDGVEDETDKDIMQQQQIFFQKLSSLTLDNLPSLVNFCSLSYNFIFPSLKSLRIKRCPKMTTIFTLARDKVVRSRAKAPQEASLSTGMDIFWSYDSELPPYIENEAEALKPMVS